MNQASTDELSRASAEKMSISCQELCQFLQAVVNQFNRLELRFLFGETNRGIWKDTVRKITTCGGFLTRIRYLMQAAEFIKQHHPWSELLIIHIVAQAMGDETKNGKKIRIFFCHKYTGHKLWDLQEEFMLSFETEFVTPLSLVWAGLFAFADLQRISPKQIAIITMMILNIINNAIRITPLKRFPAGNPNGRVRFNLTCRSPS